MNPCRLKVPNIVCSSKETLLLEPEKPAPRIETLEPEKVDEEEEGKKDQESSCSSEEEEEEDSESETEAGTFNLL
jgi:protein phosphatase 1 regulatory subunit 12A